MIQSYRVAGLAFAGFVLATGLRGQDPMPGGWDHPAPNAPQVTRDASGTLTIRTGVQLVLQDITVTDADGRPVTGLKPEDFHLLEDGRPQTIKSFEEHTRVDPVLAKQRADELAHTLPPNTFTNYKAFSGGTLVVFLLDTLESNGCGTGTEGQMHLRQEMLDYMQSVPLGTPYMILQMDKGLHMIQDMTTDLNDVTTAIHGRRNFPELSPQFAAYGAPEYVAALRRRQFVDATMNGLEKYLGAIPGRKNLVWLAGPIVQSLILLDPSGSGELKYYPTIKQYLSALGSALEQKRIALYRLEATPIIGGAGLTIADNNRPSTQLNPESIDDVSRPEPVSIFKDGNGKPVNPPGWSNQFAIEEAMYEAPASCSYPEGKERIAAIVDRSQHYYTLSYTPTNQNFNGRPRTFSVSLDDPTLRLDYRHSYTASANDTAVQQVAAPVESAAAAAVLHDATGPSSTLQTAMGMGTIEPTQVIFEASATPMAGEIKDAGKVPAAAGNFLSVKLRKQGYRNYVLHFRVRENELKLTPEGDGGSYSGHLEFVAVVYDAQGQAVNGKRERASVEFSDIADPQLKSGSVTGDLKIEVPARGNYFLRLGVRDTASDRVGALEVPVDKIAVVGR